MIIKKIRNFGYKKSVRNRAKPHEMCAISHGAHILNMIGIRLYQAGSTTLKVVLSPGFEEAVMVPPCRVTICLQILNPMPEPLVLVVKNGTKIRSITSGNIPLPLSVMEMMKSRLLLER